MKIELIETELFSNEVIAQAMSYEKYYTLIKDLLQEGKTTGNDQSDHYLKYAKLNFQRMKRVYRTTTVKEALENSIDKITKHQIWVVLTEGWCGDAAQSLPAIAKIAELSEKIDLRILLRDKNTNIIDAYLTNESRSIPKLIAIDKLTYEELFTWGPRPKEIQKMVIEHKKNPTESDAEFNEQLHRRYTLDKTESLQLEFLQLIKSTIN